MQLLMQRSAAAHSATRQRGRAAARRRPRDPAPLLPARVSRQRVALARAPRAASETEASTDLEAAEDADARGAGVYVLGPSAAMHVGFQGPGWTVDKDPGSGDVRSLVKFCSPGRVRFSFGAAAGLDEAREAVYDWGRAGWGGRAGAQCLSNSLGDEKPRFHLSARQAAEILAAPAVVHQYELRFKGWRGDKDGCPVQDESEREGGIDMTKTLTWAPAPSANGKYAPGTGVGAAAYEVTLALDCSDGFSAAQRVAVDAADWLLVRECLLFALPRLLGLPGAFRLPERDDYRQDGLI